MISLSPPTICNSAENLILWACSAIALLAVVFFRRSVRHRRHKRKQQSARRVLERIKTLPGFPQKINYLRKIDPFVFEELLLEGFEAHGFRTIRNKRYTGDGGIDGQVIIGKYRYLIQAKRYRGHIALQKAGIFSVTSFCGPYAGTANTASVTVSCRRCWLNAE
ncbi:restriction endonuclease [Enterobacter hormaechei]|uniref:restriction endonuclease n=1 Tax=Enterobacter hormaechei TaxID=158836 RepID=UPI003EB97DE0